jgi:predicted acetyltransferase
MPIEIRAIASEEVDELLVADQRGFGGPPPRPEAPRTWAEAELDRTRVAFDNGRMIAASRTYSFELTMPGGALLPVAAVSWVSVQPTHRRRGVLSQLIAAMHDDARARGESAAILTASESSIYGRFGYGIATWQLAIIAERAHVAFRSDIAGAGGEIRLVDRDEAARVLPEIYDRGRVLRAGMVTRPDHWWTQVFWDFMVKPTKANFVAVHSDVRGHDDGYVGYEITDDWSARVPERRLAIVDMQAESPAAWISLWQYAFGVDLVDKVSARNLPTDDPLRHVVTDSRRILVDHLNDHLWIAPFDALKMLSARTYAVPGRVVLEVNGPDGTKTTVAIEARADGVSCTKTTDAPDLACDSAVLGMCVLGGNRWSELATAGRVDVRRDDALLLADAMFLTNPAPALLSYF